MLPSSAVQMRLYIGESGKAPFEEWFEELDASTAARIQRAVLRLADGNFSSVKGVGQGVYEYRMDFGPGYRIYFGKDGDRLVILLAGGTKRKQDKDIENAKSRWADYKKRKKES